jgi:pimeloyl-ACP methyl ester carboxylesterase
VNAVISKDGTKIAYQTIGSGPAIILIPGALAYAHNLEPLAEELSQLFTLHVMERRGRGESGPQGEDYSIDKEVEDLNAIQDKTKAEFVFGHSFGGFLALEAARDNQNFSKIAVYEPGVSISGSINIGWIKRCQQEVSTSNYLDAFTTFVQGLNPKSSKMPHWLMKHILKIAIKNPERQEKYPLLKGTIKEHKEEARLNDTYPKYKEIPAAVLCMYGTKSGDTAKFTAIKLQEAIQNVKAVAMPGFNHLAPEDKPQRIAQELKEFFGQVS